MKHTLYLSSPHNWCDRDCDACPLATSCPIPSDHRALEDILGDAVELLEQDCREHGISTDALPVPPPPTLDAELLCRVGTDYGVALCRLDIPAGMIIAGKVARIASYIDDVDDIVWEADAVPNLLLLEKLLADAAALLAAHPASSSETVERAQQAGRLLRGLLAPLFARIPAVARSALTALIVAGRAPSPFVHR